MMADPARSILHVQSRIEYRGQTIGGPCAALFFDAEVTSRPAAMQPLRASNDCMNQVWHHPTEFSTCRLHATRPVTAANSSCPLLQCNYINCSGNASSAAVAAAVPPSSEAAAPGPGATASALAPEPAAVLQPAAAPASAPGPSSGGAESAPAGASPSQV